MIEPAQHDLDQDELTRLVADLAARPEAWQDLVVHRADARTYVELHRDEHVAVWLICWMNDHDTGYHDHDLSAGAVGVAAGARRRGGRRVGGGGPRRGRGGGRGRGGERAGGVGGAGEAFSFAPADIHRVAHAGDEPAVTIHAYS